MAREPGIQGLEEVVAVEGVVLPGILAIERDQDGVIRSVGIALGELLNLVNEIVRSVVTVPGRVSEADEIRESVVAKENTQPRTG